jgi:uncharacterized protein (TIGR00369 family)
MESDAELVRDLSKQVAAAPFHAWVGTEVLAATEGEVQVAVQADETHRNLQGLVHGGLVAALADTACGLAVRTAVEPGRRHVTVQLNVHYLAAARPGRILAHGRAVRVGGTLAYAEASVTDETGTLVAKGQATLDVRPMRSEA